MPLSHDTGIGERGSQPGGLGPCIPSPAILTPPHSPRASCGPQSPPGAVPSSLVQQRSSWACVALTLTLPQAQVPPPVTEALAFGPFSQEMGIQVAGRHWAQRGRRGALMPLKLRELRDKPCPARPWARHPDWDLLGTVPSRMFFLDVVRGSQRLLLPNSQQ